MATSWFIVVESGGQFWVDHEGKAYGPYESKAEADEGALRLARFFADELDWEVFSPENGRYRLIHSRRLDAGDRPRFAFPPPVDGEPEPENGQP